MKEVIVGSVSLFVIANVLLITSAKPKPAPASPVVVGQPPDHTIGPKPLTEAQFAELQAALKKVRDAENELKALQERLSQLDAENRSLRDAQTRDLLDKGKELLKQSTVAAPGTTTIAAPRKVAAAGCAGGVCYAPQAAPSRQYQQRTYRSGPIRRLLGR